VFAYNSRRRLLNLPRRLRLEPAASSHYAPPACKIFRCENNRLDALAAIKPCPHIGFAQANPGLRIPARPKRASHPHVASEGGYAMRTFDLSPLYRSTVGFDRLFSMLDQGLEGGAPGYPPYNIERTGENSYRVSVAVAGFNEPELSVVAKENTLTIRGERNAKEEEKRGEVLYQGIAARTFERVFQLADFVQVKGASLENGLLHVDLVREIPEAKKPRSIPINNKASGPTVIENQKAA
jgi:molecular chaperone IbpA